MLYVQDTVPLALLSWVELCICWDIITLEPSSAGYIGQHVVHVVYHMNTEPPHMSSGDPITSMFVGLKVWPGGHQGRDNTGFSSRYIGFSPDHSY